MYQKNIIFLTCVFLLFGCMDQRKLNNEADAVSSVEKKKENTSTKGITFKKNDELTDQNFERSPANVGSSGIDTVPKNRKSMLEQFTTVVWPWEKNKN